MGFHRVRFYQFRNIADGLVELRSPDVFLVGENGQGKSNILEALYLLSYGASFRTRRDSELCRLGEREMAVDGWFEADGARHELRVRYQDGRKTIRFDGEPVQDRKEIVSSIPSIVFRHDDMGFVNGPPEMQRWFVDQTLSMYRPSYIDDLRRYRSILKNRNHAIKNEQYDVLPVYDQELARTGLAIQARREEVMWAFHDVFAQTFRGISDLDAEMAVTYRPSWREHESAEEVCRYLASKRAQEIALRTTTSGPHRDRVVFRYKGRDFLSIASTGQIRLLALILRVAQASFYARQSGRRPVLLLDDVLLELDPTRRTRFIEHLPEAEQRIFTFLPGEPYEAYRTNDTVVYSVMNGGLRTQ